MKLLRRLVPLLALISLVCGGAMLSKGSILANQRLMMKASGRRSVPAESDYVRGVYDRPLSNDVETIGRAMQALDFARQFDQSKLLERFFGYCNVQRFLGDDLACTRETVRSAIDKAARLAPNAQWAVDAQLAPQLASALSLSLATEPVIRASTDSYGFWEYHSYDGPGLLRYENPAHGAFVIIAARNDSAWEVTGFKGRLTLSPPGAMPIALECDWLPFPFRWPGPLTPGTEAIRLCKERSTVKVDELLAAVHQARQDGSLSIRLEGFSLENPYVRVVDDDEGPQHLFTVHAEGNFSGWFGPHGLTPSISDQVARELAQLRCDKIASCPSTTEVASLALYDFFDQHHVWLPLLIGLLMGITIGGLRRSLAVGGILSGTLLLGAVGGLGYFFYLVSKSHGEGAGFAAMGLVGLTIIGANAFILWVPSLFVGIWLMKSLRKFADADGAS
jgi:hypothetical protein